MDGSQHFLGGSRVGILLFPFKKIYWLLVASWQVQDAAPVLPYTAGAASSTAKAGPSAACCLSSAPRGRRGKGRGGTRSVAVVTLGRGSLPAAFVRAREVFHRLQVDE